MCGKLRMHGIDISFDDMDNDYGNAVITRAHFADYLMKHGYVSSKKRHLTVMSVIMPLASFPDVI
ncbi:hypothetical protein BACPEC_02085 [[Bacteroides] pectinophilus ATCC 43243]|uniref:Uncharacterized protein n=1 Tax=[Bacteroides] pectinophilus ATCC 43243 TaxID=483218 RepID=B7ASN0_9FIRM|nr:hypothetical protein BACPEC_02085 [[Bacteroides] pectinophilus ATCC 43243]